MSDNYTDVIRKFKDGSAEKLTLQIPEGFNKVKNQTSNGQSIFTDGNTYISPDKDGHSEGVWKAATSIKNLGSDKTRLGTYDQSMQRVGE